ncbi:PREDICTED: uncharacterized protein LOC108370097 [Rhagoletis zephyria]|uniref:uncharacterized protein LOC108370097 n=1 Tax=Rhagoletis zephyria TaxID=28612 RepID=UPI00081149DA|nr:PREDICTED: uncharacterized protein LOC108370097 [Rhagoletis zephyria]
MKKRIFCASIIGSIFIAVNRTYKYLTLRAKFPRNEPVNNISMSFALLRKANGYKPFLYNFTIDACKYIKKRNNPVVKYFHSWFEKYSTINRSCPYGPQDEIVDKLPLGHINHMATEVLPVPTGEYVFHTTWIFYQIKNLWHPWKTTLGGPLAQYTAGKSGRKFDLQNALSAAATCP